MNDYSNEEPPYSFQVFLGVLVASVGFTGLCVMFGWPGL